MGSVCWKFALFLFSVCNYPTLALFLFTAYLLVPLVVEAPAGVGFSYSDNPKDYYTDDTVTAQDNYNFLLNWFDAYPEYKNNHFYIR